MEQLFEYQQRILNLRPLSKRVREAFFLAPRHRFLGRFRESGSRHWIELSEENLMAHLDLIYRDQPLVIWGEGVAPVSTISQPSFVLHQLDLLDIQPGQSVFELGTGSGWNAALMAVLCKPGMVYTYEIIAPLAEAAKQRLHNLGFENVKVIEGDGMAVPEGMTFERGIFTAGATDLPLSLHRAIRLDGRLLFVLQDRGKTDHLIVLRKIEAGFVSEKIIECGFVPVTGKNAGITFSLAPVLDALSVGERLRPRDLSLMVVPSGQEYQRGEGIIDIRQPQSTFIWTRK